MLSPLQGVKPFPTYMDVTILFLFGLTLAGIAFYSLQRGDVLGDRKD